MTQLIDWAKAHPRLTSWVVLAIGMEIIIAISAITSNVNLQPLQWVALTVAVIGVAGLCVWIISWDDDDDDEAPNTPDKA